MPCELQRKKDWAPQSSEDSGILEDFNLDEIVVGRGHMVMEQEKIRWIGDKSALE